MVANAMNNTSPALPELGRDGRKRADSPYQIRSWRRRIEFVTELVDQHLGDEPRPPWAETRRSREGRAGSIYYSRICPNDGIGILTRLKIVVLWVRIPLWAPSI